jgi:hypothetical protein
VEELGREISLVRLRDHAELGVKANLSKQPLFATYLLAVTHCSPRFNPSPFRPSAPVVPASVLASVYDRELQLTIN